MSKIEREIMSIALEEGLGAERNLKKDKRRKSLEKKNRDNRDARKKKRQLSE